MAKPPPDLRQSLKKHDARAIAPMAECDPLKKGDNITLRGKTAQIVDTTTVNPHYRPSREGMENLTGYFPPAVKHQLMQISLDRRQATGGKVTIQDLMAEALNDLF